MVTALVGIVSLLGAVAVPVSSATSVPQLVVSPSAVTPGGSAQVVGSGLLYDEDYQLQICGNNFARGSVDCAFASAVTVESTNQGRFSTTVPVVLPPTPCPCVVAALPTAQGPAITGPINIVGAPHETVTVQPPAPKVVIVHAALEGSTQPKELLGFAASRTLVLTVKNTGTASALDVTLSASIGSKPAALPALPGLSPGQVRTYRIAVTFPAFSVGTTELSGHVGVAGSSTVPFHVSLSQHPWAWVIIFLVILQLMLLAIRNLARRRVARNSVDSIDDPEPSSDEAALEDTAQHPVLT
ncbi:MAG TPA: hypothetical protein VK283_00035 [Acidimicrobiales bacterium]|nr:hypothetical protein [Acidimicrobiales bacterium]